jgi:hypothetical protein
MLGPNLRAESALTACSPALDVTIFSLADAFSALARPNSLPCIPGLFLELKMPPPLSFAVRRSWPGLLSELKPGPEFFSRL